MLARRFARCEIPDLKLVKAIYTHRLVDLLALADLRAAMLAGSGRAAGELDA